MLPDELKKQADSIYKEIIDSVESGNHHLLIMRGLPGSGKSSVSKEVQRLFQTASGVQVVRICTDEILEMSEGSYLWAGYKMRLYHSIAKDIAANAFHCKVPVIIVDNTNMAEKEFRPYLNLAGNTHTVGIYTIGGFTDEDIQNSFERNSHNVPLEAIKRMAARYRGDA